MENDTDAIKEENNPSGKEDRSVPSCCVGCVRWEKFGKSCYYYWEGKKHCTMWIGSWDDVMQQPL